MAQNYWAKFIWISVLNLYVGNLLGDCVKIHMDQKITWKRFLWVVFIIGQINFYVPNTNYDLETADAESSKAILNNNPKKIFSNENETSDANFALIENNTVGFRVLTPNNKTFFRSFPSLQMEILNTTVIESNEGYWWRISNISDEADLDSFDSFNPLNSNMVSTIFNITLKEKWDQTNETIPIFVQFFIKINSSANYTYSLNITKDLHAPTFDLGFQLTQNGQLIKYHDNPFYFTESPLVYLWITDNVANDVEVYFTVNNRKYSDYGYANNPTTYFFNGTMSSIILQDFQNMPEGQNVIYIYVNDTAGNPTSSYEITFIKDTIPPAFESGDPNTFWSQNGNVSLKSVYNPIYDAYEFDEQPTLYFSFKDDDISNFKIYVNLTRNHRSIHSDFVDMEDPTIDYISLIPIQRSKGEFYVVFPDQIWEAMKFNDLLLRIELEDRAGNIGSFTLKITRIASLSAQLNYFIAFLVLLGIIVITIVFTFLYSPIYDRLWKRHNPLEKDLQTLDPELLDVVLPPIDAVKSHRLLEFSQLNANNMQVQGAIPPDVEEILTSPMQMVDLDEIRMLLTKFKMDSLQQEEFIREMVALSPAERFEFIQNFMSTDEDDFEDISDDDDFF
ncbi:hypothetical protein WKT22_01418 [Candidatus Lokiarchaeum ossiferum]